MLPESCSIGYTLGHWPGFLTLDWMELPPVGQDHWRVREPGGGAGSPGFLTERAQLRSRAPGAVLELVGRADPEGGREGPGAEEVWKS